MKDNHTDPDMPSKPSADGDFWWPFVPEAIESPEPGGEVPFALATPRQGWDD